MASAVLLKPHLPYCRYSTLMTLRWDCNEAVTLPALPLHQLKDSSMFELRGLTRSLHVNNYKRRKHEGPNSCDQHATANSKSRYAALPLLAANVMTTVTRNLCQCQFDGQSPSPLKYLLRVNSPNSRILDRDLLWSHLLPRISTPRSLLRRSQIESSGSLASPEAYAHYGKLRRASGGVNTKHDRCRSQ